MKKVLALLVALVLMCSMVAYASTSIDKVVFELTSFGILKGDGNGNLRLDDTVTRAEFAQMVVRMLGYENLAVGSSSSFKDVPDSSWMASAVSLLSHLGYVSGDNNGNFRPNDPVLIQECEKILLHVLGYENVAGGKGGYPAGYVSLAVQINLNDGVPAIPTAKATRADAARLVYNALYSYPLETYRMDLSVFQKSDELYVKRLLNNASIKHTSGILTATYDTWLSKPLADIEENQIEVNGMLFNCGKINADKYLGCSVEVYYMEEISGRREILNIAPSDANSRVMLPAKDTTISLTEITYRDENNKKQQFSVNENTLWLYNNRVYADDSPLNLDITNGSYLLINNDYDREYEYVFMYEYESGVVDRVNLNGCIYVSNKTPIYNLDYVAVKESDTVIYSLKDSDGNKILLSDVNEGDVVTVFKSLDGSYVSIEVSKASVEGYYESCSENDFVTISDVEYAQSANLNLSEIKLGSYVIAYINAYNEVVYMEYAEEASENYGCIKNIAGTRTKEVEMIVANDLIFKTDEKNDDGDTKTIPYLICRNKEFVYYELADKVKFDGTKMTASQVEGEILKDPNKYIYTPVKFSLNSDGKIKEIVPMSAEYGSKYNDPSKTAESVYYDNVEKLFGSSNGSVVEPFGVSEETKVICIPTNSGADNDDYLVPTKMDDNTSASYIVNGYEFDEDLYCVKLMVLMSDMNTDSVDTVTGANGLVGIVTNVRSVLNEDHEYVEEVTIINEGKEIKYVSEGFSSLNGDAQNLRKGDFVIYIVNVDGELVNAKIIKRLESTIVSGEENDRGVDHSISGIVKDLNRMVVYSDSSKPDDPKSMLIRRHEIHLEDGSVFYIPQRGTPIIYIYDKNAENPVTVGTIDDIMVGDVVVASIPQDASVSGDKVKGCVIVRGE